MDTRSSMRRRLPRSGRSGDTGTLRLLAYVRESELLRARYPALYAAVTELEYAGDRKFSALTPEQRYAQFMRRVDKQQREKRRAQRQAQSQKPR